MTENQKQLLIKARELLASGREDFICSALGDAAEPETCDDYLELRRYINEQLGAMFYETWVRRNHPELFKHMTSIDFRTGRIEWINWMLGHD